MTGSLPSIAQKSSNSWELPAKGVVFAGFDLGVVRALIRGATYT